ncbi:hypothetical protein NP233_g7733 [Leucocoprinus birnbaumii]|uniref:Uncharacterized protein n=1 Tax=Leucocoprinus birnbaumii TaxID=56174 RepID=A0AAD5VNR8_9AGAR|nr:hypothetical protein NP233_g7733 [Leucocoprinus birnbaumii]
MNSLDHNQTSNAVIKMVARGFTEEDWDEERHCSSGGTVKNQLITLGIFAAPGLEFTDNQGLSELVALLIDELDQYYRRLRAWACNKQNKNKAYETTPLSLSLLDSFIPQFQAIRDDNYSSLTNNNRRDFDKGILDLHINRV